jgi:hypothetical protein
LLDWFSGDYVWFIPGSTGTVTFKDEIFCAIAEVSLAGDKFSVLPGIEVLLCFT